MKRVRGVRAFLAGENNEFLDRLERAMCAAAAEHQFERAAILRDKLQSLRWLAHRLKQMRQARTEGSFIYPTAGTWYLIHGGRTVAALKVPSNPVTARQAAELIQATYQQDRGQALEAYEHADNVMLVAAWFRRYPGERTKTLTPAEALTRCNT
jgi:excinuclease UvrABC nuclease subunit